MSATNTKTESIIIKLYNYIIKYNNETSRLLDLLIFNILSILFRIFITLFQLCLLFAFGVSVIFIPLLLITNIYMFIQYV
jgi:hypothetical protein